MLVHLSSTVLSETDKLVIGVGAILDHVVTSEIPLCLPLGITVLLVIQTWFLLAGSSLSGQGSDFYWFSFSPVISSVKLISTTWRNFKNKCLTI